MSTRAVTSIVALILLFTPAFRAQAADSRPLALVGEVQLIRVGLGVQPPGDKIRSAHLLQGLYARYRALTKQRQYATLMFRDRTVLHMNQDTDLTLRSPNLTYLRHGVVNQVLAPGTIHQLQTASAVASAVGSDFLVDASTSTVLVATREGSVLVFNQYGYVYVKTGQATRITPGQPPQQPFSYDVSGALAWRNQLASGDPTLDTNLALDANGGHVIAASSEQPNTPTERAGQAAYAIDGRLDRGWATQIGSPDNQWIKLGFATANNYSISAIALGAGPLGTHAPQQSLQDFTIRASTTGTADGDFTTVYSGKLQREAPLQRFPLPSPVTAKYIELHISGNYGDPRQTLVTEIEVIGHPGTSKPRANCDFEHDCMQRLLNLLNADRAARHVGPLQLDETLSTGIGACTGAYGHTLAMAKTNRLWHTDRAYPQVSEPNDVCGSAKLRNGVWAVNVGQAGPGDRNEEISVINQTWLGDEPRNGKCPRNFNSGPEIHFCNLMHRAFKRVGLGVFVDEHGMWATAIFTP